MEINDQILAKSLELFKRYGIRSITMDEIAGQCGISKKTLYQQYGDKDSLVMASVRCMLDHAEKGCQHYTETSRNAIEAMFMGMDMMREIFEGVNPAMVLDVRKYHYNSYAEIEQHKKQFMNKLIEQNLLKGQSEGLYRTDLKIPIIVELHQIITNLILEHDFPGRSQFSLLEYHAEILTHFLYGIATPKGAKLIDTYKQQRQKQN